MLIRYSRACGSYQDIWLLLRRKLLNQGFLLGKLKSSLRKFHGRYNVWADRYGMSITNDHKYVPLIAKTSRSFPHSLLITGFVTRVRRRVPLVEQELLTLPKHMSSPPNISGVHVTRSLIICVCFIDCCLSFCSSSFGHCIFCIFSIYGRWISLYLSSNVSSPRMSS